MKYHIVTPYARFENLERQLANLKSQQADLQWDLLVDEHRRQVKLPQEPWIRAFYYTQGSPFWRTWKNHLNRYIREVPLAEADRYLILNDDDCYEPGFFGKLDAYAGEFLVCSMLRGQHIPDSGPLRSHPTDTLMADPANLRVGRVGCEQMIVSGRLFKTITFADNVCADGMAIVELASRQPPVYVPEAFVWFNYLEPGRWDLKL